MRWTPIAWGCFHVFARGRHYFSWTSGESSPGVPVISPGTTGEPPPLGPLLPLKYHRNTFACGVIAYLPGGRNASSPRVGTEPSADYPLQDRLCRHPNYVGRGQAIDDMHGSCPAPASLSRKPTWSSHTRGQGSSSVPSSAWDLPPTKCYAMYTSVM